MHNEPPLRHDPMRKKAPGDRSGPRKPRKRIGEMMVEAGLVTERQVTEALAVQGEKKAKTAATLISLGYMTPESFVTFLARQPGVASIDLTQYEVPYSLISLIPRELATQYEVFPIDQIGNLLTLGMACPLDAIAIHELEEFTGLRIKPVLCNAGDIRAAIERYYTHILHATRGREKSSRHEDTFS